MVPCALIDLMPYAFYHMIMRSFHSTDYQIMHSYHSTAIVQIMRSSHSTDHA